MILLPTPATRASLRSYWVFLSLVAGLFATLAAAFIWSAPASTSVGSGAAIAALVAVPGLLRPYEVAPAYRAWNWLLRKFSVHAIRYVTAVCFFTVVRAASLGTKGGRFDLRAHRCSGWQARGTQSVEAYRAQYATELPSESRHWTGPLRAWLRTAGPRLASTLLPFIFLIDLLAVGRDTSASTPSNVYTLY